MAAATGNKPASTKPCQYGFFNKKMLNELNFKNSDILPPSTTDGYCWTLDDCSPPKDQE